MTSSQMASSRIGRTGLKLNGIPQNCQTCSRTTLTRLISDAMPSINHSEPAYCTYHLFLGLTGAIHSPASLTWARATRICLCTHITLRAATFQHWVVCQVIDYGDHIATSECRRRHPKSGQRYQMIRKLQLWPALRPIDRSLQTIAPLIRLLGYAYASSRKQVLAI